MKHNKKIKDSGGFIDEVHGFNRFNRRKMCRITILGTIFVLSLILLCYSCIYYHAEASAVSALVPNEEVAVTQTDYGYFFDGPSTENLYIFYPGAKVDEKAYAPLMRELAEGGMDVFLVQMPLHFAICAPDRAGDILSQYHYDNTYIGGHSMGGAMASLYASEHGDSLDGVILLASYPTKPLSDSLSEISVYGSEDGVLDMDRLKECEANAPERYYSRVIRGGNHAGFGNYGKQHRDNDALISSADQQAETAEFILSHLQ